MPEAKRTGSPFRGFPFGRTKSKELSENSPIAAPTAASSPTWTVNGEQESSCAGGGELVPPSTRGVASVPPSPPPSGSVLPQAPPSQLPPPEEEPPPPPPAAAPATEAAAPPVDGRPMVGFTTAGASGLKLLDGDGSEFRVRTGPNYKKHGQKTPSARHVYEPVAMDLLQRESILLDVAPRVQLPPPPEGAGTPNPSGLPRRLLVNIIVPTEPPPLLRTPLDGPCNQILVCFTASAEALGAWKAEDSPSYKLFARFVAECPEGPLPEKGDVDVKERLKILPFIENARAAGLPSWLEGYNGKPALFTKSGAVYRGDDWLCLSINTFRLGLITRKGMSYLMPRLGEFELHCGLTLEGRADDELDERVLCACRVRGLELLALAKADALDDAPPPPPAAPQPPEPPPTADDKDAAKPT